MNWMSLALISINLLIGYLVFLPLNKQGRHLHLNRFYLLLFPLFAIALGIHQYFSNGHPLGGFTIELPLIEVGTSEVHSSSSSIDWLFWIYVSGIVISFAHFVWSLYKIRHPKEAKFLSKIGQQRVYLITESNYSFSRFNTIYISEHQLENVAFILKHELAHSRQKHTLDLLVIRLVRCLFWFHPIMYLWESKMKENHEYLADRACIEHENDIKPYSYALLSAHLGVSIPSLANGFNRPSMLQKRIIQLKTQNTFNMKKVILIPALLTGVVLMTSLQLEKTVVPSTEVSAHTTAVVPTTDDEIKPEFDGGMTALIEYMQANIQYPKNLADKNIEAKVFVKFVVTKSGAIENVQVARGSEYEAFNTEATRVVSNMPNWKPGMKDGKPVSAEMTLPIQFVLSK